MFLAEVFRILLAEHGIEVFAGIGEFLRARDEQRIVGYVDDTLEGWHLLRIDNLGHVVTHKEQTCLGVVHNVVNLIGGELVEHGHGHGAVGQRSQKSHSPVGRVAPTKGNAVAAHHTAVFKQNVEFFYLSGHVVILQRGTLVVGNGIEVPVLDDTVLNQLIKTWYFKHDIFLFYDFTVLLFRLQKMHISLKTVQR